MPSLTVPASLEQLARVHAYIREHVPCEYEEVLGHVLLAAEELLVNIFTYAYQGAHGPAEVDCRLVQRDGQKFLCFMVKDWGPAFDPFHEAPAPDLDRTIDDRPIGGLGIHLIKTLATHVSYTRLHDANVVELYFAKST